MSKPSSQRNRISSESLDDLENFAEKKELQEPHSEVMALIPFTLQRGGLYLICVVILVTMALLYFGKVHVVVTAKGKITPEREGILVQALEDGVVIQVMAKIGDRLPKGAPLLKMDRPESRLNLASLQRKQELQKQQLQELKETQSTIQNIIQDPASHLSQELPPQLTGSLTNSVNALTRRWVELRNTTSARDQQFPTQKNQTEKELELIQQRIELLKKEQAVTRSYLVQINQNIIEKRKQLQDAIELKEKGLYSQIEIVRERDAVQAEIGRRDNTQKQIGQLDIEISNEQLRLREMKLALKTQATDLERQYELAQLNYDQQFNNLKTDLENLGREISSLQASIDNTEDEASIMEQRIRYTTLSMPTTGTIIRMNVKNPGELIGTGQVVAVVMEEGDPLIVQGSVSNKDIGFVREGLPVQVKVDAYPFQQFGTVPGKVKTIFPNIGSNDDFQINVELLEQSIVIDDQHMPLFPGLTVESDILTRKERILILLLQGTRKEPSEEEALLNQHR